MSYSTDDHVYSSLHVYKFVFAEGGADDIMPRAYHQEAHLTSVHTSNGCPHLVQQESTAILPGKHLYIRVYIYIYERRRRKCD